MIILYYFVITILPHSRQTVSAQIHSACQRQSFYYRLDIDNTRLSFSVKGKLFLWSALLSQLLSACRISLCCAVLWLISHAFTSEEAFGLKPITHSLMTQKPCRFFRAVGADEIQSMEMYGHGQCTSICSEELEAGELPVVPEK